MTSHFSKILEENSEWNKECLEWKGKTWQGYGNIYAFKKMWSVHRLAYEIYHGSIPENLYILHKCNNRKCFSKEHLYAGSAKQNSDDLKNAPYYQQIKDKIKKIRQENKRKRENIIIEKEFLTIEETSEIFNCHPNTIRRALKLGFIVGIRVGNGKKSPYRISRKSLDAIHASIIFQHAQKSKK